MSNRPHHVAFGLVLLLVLALLNLPGRTAAKLKLGVGSLFLPLFGLAGSAQGLGEQGGQRLVSRRVLLQQLAQLQAENKQLRAQLQQGDQALRENNHLRQLVGWQQQSPWRLKAARIIARDTAFWWQTVRIDVGRRDGVRVDSPVLRAEGLVGRVSEVAHTTSQVVLIGDPKCHVAVVVRETGEQGVLSATSSGVLDHLLVDLTHLPRNSASKPGQTVYTSGLGGIFPAGVPVGAIVDSRSVGYGLYTEARVKLAVDSSRLEDVMVMLP
jgi:rod shape-determining protein MreC